MKLKRLKWLSHASQVAAKDVVNKRLSVVDALDCSCVTTASVESELSLKCERCALERNRERCVVMPVFFAINPLRVNECTNGLDLARGWSIADDPASDPILMVPSPASDMW